MIRNMSQRERWLVGACIAFVLVVAVWLGVISPYRQSMELLERQIASRQQQLEEMQEMAVRYRTLQSQVRQAQNRPSRSSEFSLFSFVETLAEDLGVRDRLVSLRPHETSTRGEFTEESVEIKLERLSLEQLVQLLYGLEEGEAALNVKNMRLKTRFEDRSLFDMTASVSRYLAE